MCTAAWLIQEQGFELFFNRDESLRRGPASPPARLVLEGVRVLAPRDADAGGTWLGVNEFGLAVGLLNGHDAREVLPELRSRGLLVAGLLSARSGAEAQERLAAEALERYRAFTLLLLEPGSAPRVHGWDGQVRLAGAARLPLASSSLDRERAQTERERVFAELVGPRPEPEALTRFQRSHAPERGPWSPCMHRADALTVSASQVRVDARAVALRYAAGAPCTTPFGAWLSLERA